jgi:hypothetical protein
MRERENIDIVCYGAVACACEDCWLLTIECWLLSVDYWVLAIDC